jgi:hypothetical protein
MTPLKSQGYLLEPFMYLRDANRKAWRITAKRPVEGMRVQVALVDAAGVTAQATLDMAQEVEILVPTEDEAIAAIKAVLGPVTILRWPEYPVHKNLKPARRELAEHLHVVHRVSILPGHDKANGPISTLHEQHLLAHAVPHAGMRLLHVHFPANKVHTGQQLPPEQLNHYLGKAWTQDNSEDNRK